MSSSTPSKLPASAPTVLELGQRRQIEVARTLEASVRLALGTAPSNAHVLATSPPAGVDAHLIAIGTPPPSAALAMASSAIGTPPPSVVPAMSTASSAMKIAGASIASASCASIDSGASGAPNVTTPPEPRTVFLNAPAFVPPARGVQLAPRRPTPMPPRHRASLAVAVFLGLFALVLAPLAPLAWMHAAEQLDMIARGAYRATGKRVLHAVQGIGIAMTMVAVAATAFAFTVLVARALS